MHLEGLLAQYVDAAMALDERKRVEEHLGQCDYCRGLANAFRMIDAAVKRPSPPPSGWDAIRKKVGRTQSFYRFLMIFLTTWAVAGGIGGVIVLLVNGMSGPLWVTILALSFILDAPVMAYFGWYAFKRYKSMEAATRTWETMRLEWKRHLEEAIGSFRSRLRWVPWLWLGCALMNAVLCVFLREATPTRLAAIPFFLLVGALDVAWTRRKVAALQKEKESLEHLDAGALESGA